MSNRLTREEVRMAARFVIELLELQARGAPDEEIEEWRARVLNAFPPAEYQEIFMATIADILRAKGYDLERILEAAA